MERPKAESYVNGCDSIDWNGFERDMNNYCDELEGELDKITNWCNAYPLDIFPEPDLKAVAELLKKNGMTLDSVSASNMRHVLSGIKDILTTHP